MSIYTPPTEPTPRHEEIVIAANLQFIDYGRAKAFEIGAKWADKFPARKIGADPVLGAPYGKQQMSMGYDCGEHPPGKQCEKCEGVL